MSHYVRFFAESPITLKALSTGVRAIDPQYKIDGGDLMVGTDVIAEIGVDSAGSDLFVEDLNAQLGAVQQIGGDAAQWVSNRLRGVHSIVAIKVDPNTNWDLLGPLWSALHSLATGLTQVDGQGFYDGSNLIVRMS
jgi:hypothetical protein